MQPQYVISYMVNSIVYDGSHDDPQHEYSGDLSESAKTTEWWNSHWRYPLPHTHFTSSLPI
jgi:hypothetical protein